MKKFCALTLSALMCLNAALPVLADEAEIAAETTGEVSAEVTAEEETAADIAVEEAEEVEEEETGEAVEEEEETADDTADENEEEIPVVAYATNEADFTFSVDAGTILSYTGSESEIVIPTSIAGYSVRGLGSNLFKNNQNITSVTVPDVITSIPANFCSGCTNLKKVVLPDGITYIGSDAFANCTALTDYNIPKSLNELGGGAFKNCVNITEFDFPEGFILGSGALLGTSIKHLELKNVKLDSVGGIGYLDGMSSIESITMDNCTFLVQGYAYDTNRTMGLCRGCNNLKTVTIKNMWALPQQAFSNCPSLENVNLVGNTLTGINDNSFQGCTNLKYITIPTSVGRIGYMAFWNSGLDTVTCEYDSAALKWCLANNVKYNVMLMPPSFEVKGIFGGRTVTFNSGSANAEVYYTTANRSTLTTSDPHVKAGETVTFNAYYGTVYARTYYNGTWSNPARLILKIPKVNDPTITKLSNGKYKIKTTTPGCIVYYTIDGSTPSATNYKGKFWTSHDVSIPAGKTIKAIATRNCFSDSKVTTANS